MVASTLRLGFVLWRTNTVRNMRFSLVVAPVLALAFSSVASAQATRTWVSGVGDDANPCSRTAPCKTFAGAISKTAAGGEIDALDPGGFGALTITKSITLDGGGGQVASVLAAGTNGIVIAAGATDIVTIRNLRFDGLLGNGSSPGGAGIDGVKIVSAASVNLDNDFIFGFANYGVEVAATASVGVTMTDSWIYNIKLAGVGMTTTAGTVSATLHNLHVYNTHPAILGGNGVVMTLSDSDLSVGGTGVRQYQGGSTISVVDCQISNFIANGFESFTGSTINASGDTLSNNGLALNTAGGGTISSDGTNLFLGNGSNGSFNGTAVTKF